ncbi:diguanylate cyclase (GGDEF) domain-containing protein [Lachnospiraceae bacterium NE2001]|nr:diguanylate cyclase (GGDEF) domain-containing protein [Lachnospiraceae bacterium NE2001]
MQATPSYNSRFILKVIIVVMFVVFTVTTFLGWEMFINVLSLILSICMAVLIYISFPTTGKYKRTAICFFLAVVVWALGDVFWAIDGFLPRESLILMDISDNLYLVSDYVVLLGAIVYARDIFKKSDYQKIAVNAFIVAILTSLLGYSFAIRFQRFDGVSIELIELLLYFFVSVFSLMLAFMVVSHTGLKGHSKAFYMILITLVAYSFIDIRFTYMMIVDKDPESIYIDILYILFIMLYSFAWTTTDIKETKIVPMDKQRKHEGFIPWINSSIILILAIVLFVVKFFDTYMLLGVIIADLGYLIMCKTVQANALAEELIARQKDENARLEMMVADKIKELQQVNEHLEYISNTDVLTSLYNRRYGLGYLEKLVKDGENYPIALYSLDLNYFKPINDNYGHDMGDVVLKEVGRRLNHLGQDRCIAVRVGGDEFLVIFKNATNDVAVRGVGDIICKAMDEPIEATLNTESGETKTHTFQISASIGIAQIPGDTDNITDLYKMADEALYTVKHTSEKSSYLLFSEIESFKTKQN